MIDLDAALASPSTVFDTPESVLDESALTREQKVQALNQWAYDLRELQVATDENMQGDGGDLPAALLPRVEAALAELGAEPTSPQSRHG